MNPPQQDFSRTPGSDGPEPVVLAIADISGYTRYMTANVRSLAHSQTIITELVKTIVQQVELPLEVAKLEGDAVFLFGRRPATNLDPTHSRKALGRKFLAFFEAFNQRVGELGRSTTCDCKSCTNLNQLRLKVVVHAGEALFHEVLHFKELAGVDVIIVHRLLKNSVQSDQYLLLTNAGRTEVDFEEPIEFESGQESYDGLGSIKTLVHFPGVKSAGTQARSTPLSDTWRWNRQLMLAPARQVLRKEEPKFHHVTSGSSRASRAAFAGVSLLLAPLFLPVTLLLSLIHNRRNSGKPPEPT